MEPFSMWLLKMGTDFIGSAAKALLSCSACGNVAVSTPTSCCNRYVCDRCRLKYTKNTFLAGKRFVCPFCGRKS